MYQVKHHKYGIILSGDGVPVDELSQLCKSWKKRGYTILDTGLADKLGALFVVTNEQESAEWRAEVGWGIANSVGEWFGCGDTGLSSVCMVRHFLGREQDEIHHPHDADDFGRCLRFLERFPAYREKIPTLTTLSVVWAGIVERWSELETAYQEKRFNDVTNILERLDKRSKP